MVLENTISFFIGIFIAFFVIVNPFSTVSVFLTISRGDSARKKKQMVKRACIIAATVLIMFALFGTYILNFFNITVEAFRIAGGLLLAGVGWKMLATGEKYKPTDKEKKHAIQKEDISIIPVAIPMLAGPGAITTSIVFATQATNLIETGLILIAILIVMSISYLVLSKANIFDTFLGENGRKVADRLIGLMILVVGVQFIINGITGVINNWMISGFI